MVELQVNSNTMEVLLAEANQSKTSLLSALVSVTVCSIDWSALTSRLSHAGKPLPLAVLTREYLNCVNYTVPSWDIY